MIRCAQRALETINSGPTPTAFKTHSDAN